MLNEYNHSKTKKLTQHFKEKMGPTEVLFLQELTLTIKSNKNSNEIFKVMFFCSDIYIYKKKILWCLDCLLRKETFIVKKKKLVRLHFNLSVILNTS